MKTEQEIRQMVNTCKQYHSCAACPYNPEDISRFIGDRWIGGCPNYDRQLVYAMGKGYGDVKQAKIDVLNRVMTYINDKIEAEYGDMSDSVNYLTIDIDDFDDFIDELIKEIENETV